MTGGRLNLARALRTELIPEFSFVTQSSSVPATVQFSDETDATILSREWSFGDGSPVVSEVADPAHVYLGPGEFDVVLTVGNDEGAFASVTNTVSIFANPTFSDTAIEWLVPGQSDQHAFANNESWSEATLPFPFRFDGTVYDNVFISPHGFVSFSADGLAEKINRQIPLSLAPNNALFAYWDYLDIELSGTVTTGVIGEPPFRTFVVTWSKIMTRSSPRAVLTFQIVMEETTGLVRFNYFDVDPGSGQGGGVGASVGIENTDGSTGVMYNYNGTRPLSNGQSILWTPPAATHLAYDGPIELLIETFDGVDVSLTNISHLPIAWNADDRSPWLLVEPGTGLLAPGESIEISVLPDFTDPEGGAGDLVGYLKFASDADEDRSIFVPVSWSGVVSPSISVAGFSEQLELRLSVAPGAVVSIEASADLLVWEPIGSEVADPDDVVVFTDEVEGRDRRFYRAVISAE